MIRSRRIRWAGHVARMGEKGNACRLLVEKPEGNKPLGKPRQRWDGEMWTGLVWLGIGIGVELLWMQ
jgi:hypothetical protein